MSLIFSTIELSWVMLTISITSLFQRKRNKTWKIILKEEPKTKKKPIVVIENTPDGPVKHVFYGDAQVVDED